MVNQNKVEEIYKICDKIIKTQSRIDFLELVINKSPTIDIRSKKLPGFIVFNDDDAHDHIQAMIDVLRRVKDHNLKMLVRMTGLTDEDPDGQEVLKAAGGLSEGK